MWSWFLRADPDPYPIFQWYLSTDSGQNYRVRIQVKNSDPNRIHIYIFVPNPDLYPIYRWQLNTDIGLGTGSGSELKTLDPESIHTEMTAISLGKGLCGSELSTGFGSRAKPRNRIRSSRHKYGRKEMMNPAGCMVANRYCMPLILN